MVELNVELGERAYPVVITDGFDGLAARLAGRRRVLIADSALPQRWIDAAAAELGVAPILLDVSEATKTVATWQRAVDALLAAGVDRRTLVCALGGGVLGDIVGFAAASTNRGLPFVQLPTTLLAMVDSSVGGKTGVNHTLGKNLIGAFHQPDLVWASLDSLGTLPERELRAGLAEVVKTALIGDARFFERLESIDPLSPDELPGVVARCVQLKAQVVAADEREAGVRAVLNAGHTVGHAYEAVLGYGVLKHGEAVGLGLIAETAWAVRAGHCADPGVPARLERLLHRLGLPTEPPKADPDALVNAMRRDKKGRGDSVRLPVQSAIGAMMMVDLPFASLPELIQR